MPKVDYIYFNPLVETNIIAAASSTEIRDALKNEELQKLIRNIDCSANTEAVSIIIL